MVESAGAAEHLSTCELAFPSADKRDDDSHPERIATALQRKYLAKKSSQAAVRTCGLYRLPGEQITLRGRKGHGAAFVGCVRCGSVWACPDCARTKAAQRSREVTDLITDAVASGASVAMGLVTISHTAKERLSDVLKAVQRIVRLATSGRNRARLEALGVIGIVKSVEVTLGVNGWHPHIHMLAIHKGSVRRIKEHFFASAQKVAAEEGRTVTSNANGWSECNSVERASEYVTKVGQRFRMREANEMTGTVTKGRSQWQILQLASEGCERSAAQWYEFETSIKGTRQLSILGRNRLKSFIEEARATRIICQVMTALATLEDVEEVVEIEVPLPIWWLVRSTALDGLIRQRMAEACDGDLHGLLVMAEFAELCSHYDDQSTNRLTKDSDTSSAMKWLRNIQTLSVHLSMSQDKHTTN